jgi:hypothetical protein
MMQASMTVACRSRADQRYAAHRDLNSASLGIDRHVSGVADRFNGHIDESRISHIQRSDGWIETTRNNMSNPRCVRRGRGGRAGRR